MKRKIPALILALALLLSVGIIATANTNPNGTTGGSIEFEAGAVTITPPGGTTCFCCDDCCPAVYDLPPPNNTSCTCKTTPDPRCPCPCTCPGDPTYDNFFAKLGVARNLYFGEHALTIFGRFDSANKTGSPQDGEDRYTTEVGEYTGVEVINQRPGTATISVDIGRFMVGATPTLNGATLQLMRESAFSSSTGGFTSVASVTINASTEASVAEILTVDTGREVRAAWYGILNTNVGTAIPGDAQAVLTWTSMSGSP